MDDLYVYHAQGSDSTEVIDQATAGSATTRFVRALTFGLLGAAAGAAIYFAILALTGYEIGLVAIVVGLIVGKAVHVGSRGRGGWAYQTLAVSLTYSAIVVTYIPFILFAADEQFALEEAEFADGQVTVTAMVPNVDAGDAVPIEISDAELAELEAELAALEMDPIGIGGVLMGVGFLFVIAALAPVLAGFENIVGLLIIGFALHQAWSLNRRGAQRVEGPSPVPVAAR
jgi:hypothetical protein